MKEQILLFHFEDTQRLSAVRKAMLPLHLPCHVVAEENWEKQLGALVGLECAPADEDAPDIADLTEEMLVLCGLGGNAIQAAVTALRKAGVYIPYKASLTSFNKDWTAPQLFGELCREHAAMQEMRKAQQKSE